VCQICSQTRSFKRGLNTSCSPLCLMCLPACDASEGQSGVMRSVCLSHATCVTVRTTEVSNVYVNLNVIINSSSAYEYLQNRRVKLRPTGCETFCNASGAKRKR
jgi:hypothetical protein